jgi:hypothetical protein
VVNPIASRAAVVYLRDGVTRPEELAAIDTFIETYGVRRCPPRYTYPTSAYVPAGIAAARLAAMELKAPLEYARLLHQLLVAWR